MTSTPVTGGPELPQERRLVTAIPGPRSQEKLARRARHVAKGVGTTLPVFVEAAGGGVLVDADGNSLIDLASGIAVASVGNAAPHVVDRVVDQVRAFTHTCFMVTPYDVYVDVCEQLAELTPGDHEKRSALLNSGAEAVENAVKVARAYTGRDAVAVVDHAYHGRTNLTMAMTSKSMPYKHGFGPFAGEVYRAPMSYPFREPHRRRADHRCRRCRPRDRRPGEAGGRRPTSPAWSSSRSSARAASWSRPRASCPGCASGPPRTASSWSPTRSRPASAAPATGSPATTRAWCPDLVTTAKGIAGGFPLAAVTGRAEIMDAVHVGGLGGTYGGNPVACAAALGAIETMQELDLRRRGPGRSAR